MGRVKLLSDKAVNLHPYYDDGELKIDRTRKKKRLNEKERELKISQVHEYYRLKYRLTKPIPKEVMQDLWDSPRNVRRRFFLSAMHALGHRVCAF